mmetsp:Transcript_3833/g.9838  ORF Transcript_3833/g.9838 Transcript_3833/m.9838 type:complete len:223 (-) Transcript_3833:710-1378(-)
MRVVSGATGLLRCWRGTRSSHARTRPACLLPNRKRLGGHGARRSGRADHDALDEHCARRAEQQRLLQVHRHRLKQRADLLLDRLHLALAHVQLLRAGQFGLHGRQRLHHRHLVHVLKRRADLPPLPRNLPRARLPRHRRRLPPLKPGQQIGPPHQAAVHLPQRARTAKALQHRRVRAAHGSRHLRLQPLLRVEGRQRTRAALGQRPSRGRQLWRDVRLKGRQ